MRRLDPWAALLLGVLLALGVVILLATPGPWQRVVGQEPPVRFETPAPDDVAVFVLGGRAGSCTGIVWLHLDPTQNALSAVVVAPRVSGFVPWGGAAPLAQVVDAAGAGAGAAALGRALGVSMDAWVTLDRRSLELVVQHLFPMTDVRAARTRYREARAAWRGRGAAERAWAAQYETLRVALPRVAFSELGVVAFSNYVLGFGFVESDLTLEGATSLGEALQEVDPARVSVRGGAGRRGALQGRGGVAPRRQPHGAAAPVAGHRPEAAGDRRPGHTPGAPGARARRRPAAARERIPLRRRSERAPGPVGRSPGGGHAGGRRRRQAGVSRRARARRTSGPGRPGRPGAGGSEGHGGGRQGLRDAAQPRPGGGRRRTAAGAHERSRRLRGEKAAGDDPHRDAAAGLLVPGGGPAGRRRRLAPATAWTMRHAPTCRRSCAPAGRVHWRRVFARRG